MCQKQVDKPVFNRYSIFARHEKGVVETALPTSRLHQPGIAGHFGNETFGVEHVFCVSMLKVFFCCYDCRQSRTYLGREKGD